MNCLWHEQSEDGITPIAGQLAIGTHTHTTNVQPPSALASRTQICDKVRLNACHPIL